MSEPRYGVYLRPDPALCWAVTQITGALRAQFGLVSAAAFPPHVTIVGHLLTDASLDVLIDAVDRATDGIAPIELVNAGIPTPDPGIPLDVHTDGHGRPRPELQRLAERVFDAVLPLAVAGDSRVNPRRREDFWAHVSLASHDLAADPALYDQVRAFVSGLPIEIPARSVADTVSLFELRAEAWEGPWWRTLQWRHRRSWTLRGPGAHHGTV